MKCSAFIACSVDGFIATPEGKVDWLEQAGDPSADLGDQADMGMNDYLKTVDCMIMGRKCMEVISSFNLSPEQWPYGDLNIIVLSRTLQQAPANMRDKVEIYGGDINALINRLEQEGYTHAYVDGGTTITSFLNLKRIDEITITQAPVLIGSGIPLFGQTNGRIVLDNAQAHAYANNFVQYKYQVRYR